MDAIAQHVVVVADNDPVLGVDDLPLVALDVDHHARRVGLLRRCRCIAVLKPIVRHRDDGRGP